MKTDNLTCPYNECKKEFEKPLVLTDFSKTPRETYYACPHCLTKVNILVKDSGIESISVKTSENHIGKTTECGRYFGYLKTLPREAAIPDECLTCPRLLQCFIEKEGE